MKETLEKIKKRGYWEIIIHPQQFIKERIQSFEMCKQLILETKVSLRGWDFPHYDFQHEPTVGGLDYIEQATDFAGQIEYWRYYQSGQFIFFDGLKEDWLEEDGFLGRNRFSIEPLTSLEIINTLYLFTEIFEFAARLASKDVLGDSCKIQITLHGAQHRKLIVVDSNRWFPHQYICEIPEIPYEVPTTTLQLLSNSSEMALEGIVWLFQRFNWDKVNKDIFKEDQRKFLEKRI